MHEDDALFVAACIRTEKIRSGVVQVRLKVGQTPKVMTVAAAADRYWPGLYDSTNWIAVAMNDLRLQFSPSYTAAIYVLYNGWPTERGLLVSPRQGCGAVKRSVMRSSHASSR